MSKFTVWASLALSLTLCFEVFSAATLPNPRNSKGDIFAVLSLLSEFAAIQETLNDTVVNCPKLWAHTESDFIKQEQSGILGFVNELQKDCPENKTEESLLCKGALGVSKYVCKASDGGKLPLVPVNDTASLNNTDTLCNTIFHNLCKIVYSRINSHLALKTSLAPLNEALKNLDCNFNVTGYNKDICTETCNIKKPVCKITLQSLRTIVSWEEEKEKKESVNNAEPTDMPDANNKSAQTNKVKSEQIQQPLRASVSEVSSNQPTQTAESAHDILPQTETGETSVSSTDKKPTNPPVPAKKENVINAISTPESDGASPAFPETTLTQEYEDGGEKPPVRMEDEDPQIFDEDPLDPRNNGIEDEDDPEKGMAKTADGETGGIKQPAQSFPPTELDNDDLNTHFLFYFIAFVVLSVCGYLMYVRRKHIVALVIEGRTRSGRRRSNSLRERSSAGSYRKLVNNLEEAISSSSVKNSNVIY